MSSHGNYKCEPDPGFVFPGGSRPPQIHAYPSACPPVRLLFVGWNPPRPFGGFWVVEAGDTLRADLHWILSSLKGVEAPEPDAVFVDEFRRKGFFFVHAVKCWTQAKYPGFGRKAKREDRDRLGEPLLRACASMHLGKELGELAPRRVCALGEVPFLALAEVWRTIPIAVRPTEGRSFGGEEYGLPWDLLYTCFPSPAPAGRGATESLREVARRHVAKFLGVSISPRPTP